MALVTDAQVRGAIRDHIEAAFGSDTRVLTRWRLALSAQDWKGVVRSLASDGKVDGWVITRKSATTETEGIGGSRFCRKWTYALWYFKQINDGTDEDNSELHLNAALDLLMANLEDDPQLGFNESGDGMVQDHDGLQIVNIDTVNDQYHYVIAELTVNLTRQ